MSITRKSGISIVLAALWLCASGSLPAQTFTTLLSFDGADGSTPLGLVQATDGNLYGTTQLSNGSFFKITPSGTLTTLFRSEEFNNSGIPPQAGLIRARTGTSTEQRNTAEPARLLPATAAVGRSSKLPRWHVHHAAQLSPNGRRQSRRRADPGHRPELLRNNVKRRG